MPDFIHDLPAARQLFEIIAAEKGIPASVVEKDYWVMHCLWGLIHGGFQYEMKGGTSLSKGWRCIDRFSEDIDIRFIPPEGLETRKDKPEQKTVRLAFYQSISDSISIPGVTATRLFSVDDEKAHNAGISLAYSSHFPVLEGLKPIVLLELGFARTAPFEELTISSWAYDRVQKTKIAVVDNRAVGVRCFVPEYTFVDKLQTVCRRYRQHRDRQSEFDRPRQFVRHYYDLYCLLNMERVKNFIGTPEYTSYLAEKISGLDKAVFVSRKALTFPDQAEFLLYEREFVSLQSLLLSPGPTFVQVVTRLRDISPCL